MEQEKKDKKESSSHNKDKEILKQCQQERDDYLAGWKRARADFLNYKKEEEEKIAQLIDYKFRDLILTVLPLMDELDKAAEHLPADLKENHWATGVLQIKEKFEKTLAKEGIQRMEVLGKQFNPKLHNAVEMVKDGKKEPGTIVEVVREGYLLNGSPLRVANVKVAK